MAERETKVAELESTLAEKKKELEDALEKAKGVAKLEASVAERDTKVAELEATLAEKEAELEEAEASRRKLQLKQARRKRGSDAGIDSQSEQQQTRVAELEAKVADLESALATKEGSEAEAVEDAADKGEEPAVAAVDEGAQDELNKLRANIAELEAQVEEADATLKRVRESRDETETRHEILELNLQEMQREMQHTEAQLESVKTERDKYSFLFQNQLGGASSEESVEAYTTVLLTLIRECPLTVGVAGEEGGQQVGDAPQVWQNGWLFVQS